MHDNLLEGTISKFEKEKVNENGWSNRTLHLLRVSLNQCKKRQNEHIIIAERCSNLHKIISIPGMISNGLATSLAFWIVGSPSSAILPVTASIAALSSISTIMNAIENTLKYNEQEYNHKKAVDIYGELVRRIELNIIQPTSNANHILSEIIKDYEVAVSHCPYIGFFDDKKNIYNQ